MFNSLFLDRDKISLLTKYLLKMHYINKYIDDRPIKFELRKVVYSKYSLRGIKKLLILLTLYDRIGFTQINYSYDDFYNMGFEKLDEEIFWEEQTVKDALLLMRMNYRKLKYNFESNYKYKVEMFDFKELLLNVFIPYMGEFCHINVNDNYLNLANKFVVKEMSVDLTMISFFYQTMLALMEGIASKADFYTSIFESNNNLEVTYSSKDIIDNIYYICRLELPKELNILPIPQTLEDVVNYRKSPYIKSFRSAFQEWMSYVEEGNISLAKKVEKDVIKANKYFEKLEKYHRFSRSPFVRTSLFAGGFIPVVSELINISTYAGGLIEDGLTRKNNWVLIANSKK